MFLAKIYVTFKPAVNDPEGMTILASLHDLGFNTIEKVRYGKYIEVHLNEVSKSRANNQVSAICEKLLANPVIENYRFELANVDR